MANELKMAEIDSILALHQRNWSNRRIARELGIHRDTVARHLQACGCPSKPARAPTGSDDSKPATQEGGAQPAKQASAPTGSPTPSARDTQSPSLCEPWRQIILDKLEAGLSAQRIYQDLVSEHGFVGKYPSVRRFVHRLGRGRELPFRRLECAVGEEAQVDFGSGIPITGPDGKKRRSWVFRIVLSHSRKAYSEAVYRQTTENFIRCLENAFRCFNGVPRILVIDNLRAAVAKADWYEPDLQPKICAFCTHYHVTILPTRPRMPRHKGKVEKGVEYVKENGLRGHVFATLEDENAHLRDWEADVADRRIHGTTRQQVGKLFVEAERSALQPLPAKPFPFFHEGQRNVHRDGHVEVDKSYYSVPPEYLGRTVWARWDSRLVHVFNERLEQIAVHVKQIPGQFSTQKQHIAVEKISGIERGVSWQLTRLQGVGPQTQRWAEAVVQERGIEAVRVLQGLRHLADKHASAALEKACATACSHGVYRLRIIRELLKRDAGTQQEFAFIDQHPVIRSLAEYGQWLRSSLSQTTEAR